MKDEPLTYDADVGPDPEGWLSSDEDERIEAVAEYHRSLREPHPATPSPQLHAGIHATVEYQIALGDETPVKATLERLLREGLERHDAIHAIGSVLAEHMWTLMRDEVETPVGTDPSQRYYTALERLDVEAWRTRATRGDETMESEFIEDDVFEEDLPELLAENILAEEERGAGESSAARRERRRKRKRKRRR